MNFYSPESIRFITQGEWLECPDGLPALKGIGIDTREELLDKVFVAIKGERFDAHDFLDAAVAGGSRMLIVEKPPQTCLPSNIAILRVVNTRLALGRLAN